MGFRKGQATQWVAVIPALHLKSRNTSPERQLLRKAIKKLRVNELRNKSIQSWKFWRLHQMNTTATRWENKNMTNSTQMKDSWKAGEWIWGFDFRKQCLMYPSKIMPYSSFVCMNVCVFFSPSLHLPSPLPPSLFLSVIDNPWFEEKLREKSIPLLSYIMSWVISWEREWETFSLVEACEEFGYGTFTTDFCAL